MVALEWLKKSAPKTFLFKFCLQTGAIIVALVMSAVMLCSVIGLVVQLVMVKACSGCSSSVNRNNYGMLCAALVYSMVLLFVSLWAAWGAQKAKSSVVIAYTVVYLMWWLQVFALLIILIILYSEDASLVAWLLALIFGLIALGILLYGCLVLYAYWIQLKLS